jgi:hypothetical protein
VQFFAKFLKVSLPKLKAFFLKFVVHVDAIVTISVGPFQNLSSSNDFVTSVQQESQFTDGIVFQFL